MKDVSIEYAHIYTNSRIGDEHSLSLEVLEKIHKEQAGDSSLVVLIDDYSFPDPSFDYASFSEWLAGKGFKPDAMFRESQLIPVCDEVLKLIGDQTLKEQISDYVRAKKYPCSLFIAAWYLLRLGSVSHQLFDPSLAAKKLVNILPSSFSSFEDKAIEIIKSTPFSGRVEDIENKYFEGRLIA